MANLSLSRIATAALGVTEPAMDGCTLRTCALAAVAANAEKALSAADSQPEAHYLLAQLKALDTDGAGWRQAFASYLSHPAAEDELLVGLMDRIGLTTVELLAIALAMAVDEDALAGRALAYVQAPVGGARPTLGLLATVLEPAFQQSGKHEKFLDVLLTGVAVRSGLLVVLGEAAPLPERAVAVSTELRFAVRRQSVLWPNTSNERGRLIPLPASILDQAKRHGTALAESSERTLVLRTNSPSEGGSVAACIAEGLGKRPVFIENIEKIGAPAAFSLWLTLCDRLPVFMLELSPGERRLLPDLPFYAGPVLVLCGPDGSVETAGGAALSWSLPVPPRDERRLLWQQALDDPQAADLADELARHHRHSSGRIAHLGRLAQHYRALEEHPSPTRTDVLAAAWVAEGGGLDALAQPMPAPIPDEALVIPTNLRLELEALLMRCRSRDDLVQGLGASATARYHPGVQALFVGPSGTGKTLAAGWLATRLGLPLYRVDLASVTSKYIGETEKNLSQLLARAEQAEVVLLFDEADSFFGKRTDVQQANDRFANAQTNYLLQRIETYDGITILTSNSRSRFDPAFTRRLDMILEFPVPNPEERRALWLSHLGKHHRLSPTDINRLAASADLTGGHIRNVVLAAAVLAHNEGRPIEFGDISDGLAREYRKLGLQMPMELQKK